MENKNFTCRRCGFETDYKVTLVRHFNRKNKCQPTVEDISIEDLVKTLEKPILTEGYQCEHCQKYFKTSQSKYQHKKRCKAKITKEERNKQLEKRLEELEKKVQAITASNIHINAFGEENVSYLLQDPDFPGFFINCLRTKVNGLCEYIIKKHFDNQHPENSNIRKLVKKDPFIETFNGEKWIPRFSHDVLDLLFINIRNDYDYFIGEAYSNNVIEKDLIDDFMKDVGYALDYDIFESKSYEVKKKDKKKKDVYRLACEYIYKHSKMQS